ncbi:MAG: DUF3110 domain-containing protein [Leptolyngbya sp. Prado105]|jgi:hypothetical protein|nr:DUF3110 domain-containing protein [Leptolyngbya sp. Prado105]
MQVFVLLFNADTDNPGIHTISVGNQNLVLMFAQQDDADRYAMMLEAQDFAVPTVERIEQEEIEEFCQDAGYEAYLIPENFMPQNEFERLLLAPPESNRDEMDWSPEEKRKQEEAEMSNKELDRIRRQLEGLL